jgi:VanZ family protein
MTYHLRPFDFTVEHHRVVAGLSQFLAVPFSSYYSGSEFHAFTEASRKSLLALPLGLLLRLSWPEPGRWPASRLRLIVLAGLGFCVLFAIEVGQVFLPTRVPDVTDAIVGELGVVAGLWLAGLFAASLPDRPSPPDRVVTALPPPQAVAAPVAGRPRRFTFVSMEEANQRKGPQGRPGRPRS